MRIGLIGSSDETVNELQVKIAEELGFILIENGFTIINGGMGGIMRASAKGARKSTNFQSDSVIAVLKSPNKGDGNPYSSIKILTDLGTGRNRLIILNSDAVIAIGGGAGTLTEIALAWEFNKPIAAFRDSGGWSAKLAGKAIDSRRDDSIFLLDTPMSAIEWVNSLNS